MSRGHLSPAALEIIDKILSDTYKAWVNRPAGSRGKRDVRRLYIALRAARTGDESGIRGLIKQEAADDE